MLTEHGVVTFEAGKTPEQANFERMVLSDDPAIWQRLHISW